MKYAGAGSHACFVVKSRKLAEDVARDIENDVTRHGAKKQKHVSFAMNRWYCYRRKALWYLAQVNMMYTKTILQSRVASNPSIGASPLPCIMLHPVASESITTT